MEHRTCSRAATRPPKGGQPLHYGVCGVFPHSRKVNCYTYCNCNNSYVCYHCKSAFRPLCD